MRRARPFRFRLNMRRPSSDGLPQGDPEYVRDLHRERQLGLVVRGEYVEHLALLALRCERRGETLIPLTLSIAETPIVTTVFRNAPNA